MIFRIQLFIYTLRYLKLGQVYARLWFRIYRPRFDLSSPPLLKPWYGKWSAPCVKDESLTGKSQAHFLNIEMNIERPDIWNDSSKDKLWLYNLHYFDDLNCRETLKKKQLHSDLIQRWINENPPAEGCGWDPYPLSLRVVNWIKWSTVGNTLDLYVIDSLAIQSRWLMRRLEYHLLGNHLFENAKALVFTGAFFSGDEADKWLKKGLQILDEQINEQVLDDGGHFELSPMYHAIILEDLLDLINLAKASKHPSLTDRLAGWEETVKRMLHWLAVMTHPDEEIAFFNDAAIGIAANLTQLSSYAKRLDLSCDKKLDEISQLPDSGYIRVSQKGIVALLDVAKIGPDYLPGHAHADSLSFELSIHGKRFIVNSGTSCYGGGKERLRQRGTSAHSTVEVDGKDSSEVWGGFRVARRAYPFGLRVGHTETGFSVSCSHDGYSRLNSPVSHKREWLLGKNVFSVTDALCGNTNNVISRYYFFPEWRLSLGDNELIAQDDEGRLIRLFWTGGDAKLLSSTYHPEFGVSVSSHVLVIQIAALKSKIRVEF